MFEKYKVSHETSAKLRVFIHWLILSEKCLYNIINLYIFISFIWHWACGVANNIDISFYYFPLFYFLLFLAHKIPLYLIFMLKCWSQICILIYSVYVVISEIQVLNLTSSDRLQR
jgi:hypothetical protein